jgi:hypothetical protein
MKYKGSKVRVHHLLVFRRYYRRGADPPHTMISEGVRVAVGKSGL